MATANATALPIHFRRSDRPSSIDRLSLRWRRQGEIVGGFPTWPFGPRRLDDM
jgi:hypothetical protein